MHWGNIGSFIAGLSALTIAIAALIRSPAALRDWRDRQRAQAEAAREEAKSVQLERRRGLEGWSRMGIGTFHVSLVTDADELRKAAHELASGHPTAYVTICVPDDGNSTTRVNQAATIRQFISNGGGISRPPTPGELEAVEVGLDKMGIPAATYGRLRRGGQ